MYPSRGTVRYEERGQGYLDVEKVGKHWTRLKAKEPRTRVSISDKEKNPFYSKMSTLGLEPTLLPVQWVLAVLLTRETSP